MFVAVENVFNIYEDRWWYYIPGFNGYEISNDGYIRSMKHYKQYPFGILIQPKKDKNGILLHPEDPSFELSDNNNERKVVRLSQLQYLASNNPYSVGGYPRRTCITDISSRNQRCTIKKKLKVKQPDNTIRYPKFTIIEDTNDAFGMEKRDPDIVEPIVSINGGISYGRKDIRLLST